MNYLIKINFTGGLISPGELHTILQAAQLAGVTDVRFGLRQVLWIEVNEHHLETCLAELSRHKIFFELDADECPNIISSYPAQDVFIQRNWLSEGIYKDIFDGFSHKPRLKVNIADSAQSFTPMLTGHINWIASHQVNYWYLTIRFPQTNRIYTWSQWVDTSEIARMSKKIEQLILERAQLFVGNSFANGDLLFEYLLSNQRFNTTPATNQLELPMFMLPYYEGINRYDDKLWLGIYRRNELFSVAFLLDVCALCLRSQIGLICSTSWKSLIIKNIEPAERNLWDGLLAKHQINVRHAANELNFQIEDHAPDALALKNELVQHLSLTDTRTFGVCIGIKTRSVGEVFCSILIVRRRTRWRFVYDILLAQDFNPNQRTGEVFAKNITRRDLPARLRGAILQYYAAKNQVNHSATIEAVEPPRSAAKIVHQCPNCLTIYDDAVEKLAFAQLPSTYVCECCDAPQHQFKVIDAGGLFLV